MSDDFLVARADCGCVQCVQLPTSNSQDVDTFLAAFPHEATR